MWPMREQLMLCSAWGRITGTESGVMLHVPSGVSEQPWEEKKMTEVDLLFHNKLGGGQKPTW